MKDRECRVVAARGRLAVARREETAAAASRERAAAARAAMRGTPDEEPARQAANRAMMRAAAAMLRARRLVQELEEAEFDLLVARGMRVIRGGAGQAPVVGDGPR